MYYEEDILNTFERLPLNESVSHASMIPVMESDRLDSYVVKLDDILSYQDANSLTLDECLDNICEENSISKDHIAISYVIENAVYDDDYYGVLNNFLEANYNIYALGVTNPYKDIINESIDEYLDNDYTGVEPLNEFLDTLQRAVSSQMGARTGNTLRRAGGNIIAGAKLGIAQALSNKADRFIGSHLDKEVPTGYKDKNDTFHQTGTKIVQGGKISSPFLRDIVQGMRKNATEGLNDTLRNLIGVDKHGNNSRGGILSIINNRMNSLRSQQASERDPNRRNVIMRTLEKLRNLASAITNRQK